MTASFMAGPSRSVRSAEADASPRTADLVVDVTPSDAAVAEAKALASVGKSYDQLKAEADSGHFTSLDARLAWMVVRLTHPMHTA